MTQFRYKYIEALPALTPIDAALAAGDRLLEALAKLQGQIRKPMDLIQFHTPGPWSWTNNVGARRIYVEIYGAGAGAGFFGGILVTGPAGGWAERYFDVAPGETYSGVIGAGGFAGSFPASLGASGTDTTFLNPSLTELMRASGATSANPGTPGTGTGAGIISGTGGGATQITLGLNLQESPGGGTKRCGGGGQTGQNATGAGLTGKNFGAGGGASGGSLTGIAGAGAPGAVLIFPYGY